MTRSGAEELVRSVRYWPEGARGSYSGSRAANWGLTQSASDYFTGRTGTRCRWRCSKIAAAFDSLSDLCSVPGLDLFFLGAGDLAMSMGLPGQASHPSVVARVDQAIRSSSPTADPQAPWPLHQKQSPRCPVVAAALSRCPQDHCSGPRRPDICPSRVRCWRVLSLASSETAMAENVRAGPREREGRLSMSFVRGRGQRPRRTGCGTRSPCLRRGRGRHRRRPSPSRAGR